MTWPIRAGIAIGSLVLMACSHSDAFTPAGQGSDTPFDALQPTRLTFGQDSNLTPAWSPDGASIFYTFRVPNDPDRDRCAGVLPATGGSRVAEKCPITDFAGDSTTVFRWPAPGAGGLMAWTEYQTFTGHVTPDAGAIRIGTFEPADPGRPVRSLPYLAPSGLVHDVATYLAWLSPSELVYVANTATYLRPCINCPFREYLTGLEIVRLALEPEPATVVVVPGTAGATSAAVPAGGGGFYYTIAGDSRVWWHDDLTGTPVPVHDFAGVGVPRSASVQGNRLVAGFDSSLAVVDLATGATTVYADTMWSVGPVKLSPDGSLVAAEMINLNRSGQVDLYRFELP